MHWKLLNNSAMKEPLLTLDCAISMLFVQMKSARNLGLTWLSRIRCRSVSITSSRSSNAKYRHSSQLSIPGPCTGWSMSVKDMVSNFSRMELWCDFAVLSLWALVLVTDNILSCIPVWWFPFRSVASSSRTWCLFRELDTISTQGQEYKYNKTSYIIPFSHSSVGYSILTWSKMLGGTGSFFNPCLSSCDGSVIGMASWASQTLPHDGFLINLLWVQSSLVGLKICATE